MGAGGVPHRGRPFLLQPAYATTSATGNRVRPSAIVNGVAHNVQAGSGQCPRRPSHTWNGDPHVTTSIGFPLPLSTVTVPGTLAPGAAEP